MTRFLTRLADLAYRRRGRMVLAWIAATVVIIGVGSSLAGRVRGRLRHPGLGVQGGERPHGGPLRGLLGPGDLRRLEGRARRSGPRRQAAARQVLRRGHEGRQRGRPDPDPGVGGRQDRHHHAAAVGPRLGGREGGRREADRRRRGERRRRARAQARRRPDLRGAGGGQPRGPRLPRRRDRAADRLRLGGGRRAPAPDRTGRPRHHLGRPDRPARQRRRRSRLDDGGVRS